MKKSKEPMNALVASLMPDSDKKMGSIAGASLVVALALCFWAATYERLIEDVVFVDNPNTELTATMNIIEKKEEKKEVKQERKPCKPINRKRPGGGGKSRGNGKPNAPESRGVLKELAAMTKNVNANAYTLVSEKFAKDIDKVLKNASGLQVTGKTAINSTRRGKADAGFNEGYASGGSGGIDGMFSSLVGGSTGALSTKAKGQIKPPSVRDIDMGSAGSARSAADIMKVVRNRTPGLRHIYNKHLKKNPGFQGKVTLRFTIAPGGEIISISIVSSTTGYSSFDNEIKDAVGRWTFNKVKSGNTTVTIPFTFSE